MAESQLADGKQSPGGFRWHRGYGEVVTAAVLLVGMIFFRLRLESFVLGRAGSFLGPSFWPATLLTIGIVLSAAYLVLAVVWARRGDTTAERPAEPDLMQQGSTWKLVAGAVLLGAYIYLLGPIGFAPATALFSVAFLLVVGERRWWVIVVFPVVALTILIGVFTQLLTVSLPRGTGFLLTLSTYLY